MPSPEKATSSGPSSPRSSRPARATDGVINFDIAHDLHDPDSFIATAVYEDGAALERQESRPEVHRAMAIFPDVLAGPPERTIFDASINPVLV